MTPPRPFAAALCRLGRHRADESGARWNAGYGFTRCRGCGRDMVRSLLGEWHVPRGHRVVWRDAVIEEEAVPATAADTPSSPVTGDHDGSMVAAESSSAYDAPARPEPQPPVAEAPRPEPTEPESVDFPPLPAGPVAEPAQAPPVEGKRSPWSFDDFD